MTTEYPETPYHIEVFGDGTINIFGINDEYVADCGIIGASCAVAEFIVRACNSYDDLVKALQDLLNVLEFYKEPEKVAAAESARIALSKAKGAA